MKNAAATQRIIMTAAAAIGPVTVSFAPALAGKTYGEPEGETAAAGLTAVSCAAEPPMTPQAVVRVKGVA
jgi:hypothetical protein